MYYFKSTKRPFHAENIVKKAIRIRPIIFKKKFDEVKASIGNKRIGFERINPVKKPLVTKGKTLKNEAGPLK